MKAILIYFGLMDEPMPKENYIPTFRTVMPDEQLSFQEWCDTMRVSMLHGKHTTYFG